ncbi:unnamed protein product [Didymodactylos carnosus]|uniref:Uncharacterized protein n=1 Tax=Didymodactylos carnosus TaxID=1234261 RepID=A0A815D6I2_9BILA|nr:unnamed protein product [Didymodactylos carnosus]CAF1293830.1 unnamed protein product [Didymodactylos carnosus]CAF4079738.1 unnamed protein product [Didymodactylos carnosus]CAF4104665.1 unnamed protein product [Didymodactylos carnosus]
MAMGGKKMFKNEQSVTTDELEKKEKNSLGASAAGALDQMGTNYEGDMVGGPIRSCRKSNRDSPYDASHRTVQLRINE